MPPSVTAHQDWAGPPRVFKVLLDIGQSPAHQTAFVIRRPRTAALLEAFLEITVAGILIDLDEHRNDGATPAWTSTEVGTPNSAPTTPTFLFSSISRLGGHPGTGQIGGWPALLPLPDEDVFHGKLCQTASPGAVVSGQVCDP